MVRALGVTSGVLVLLLTGFLAVSCELSDNRYDYCIDETFEFAHVTSTIQLISVRREQGNPNGEWLLLGHITEFGVTGPYIVGYLSMRYAVKDGIVGLAGEHGREGYFLINKMTRAVTSGLSYHDLDRMLLRDAGISLKQVKFIRDYERLMELSCVLPERVLPDKWRLATQPPT